MNTAVVDFVSYTASIPEVMDKIGASSILAKQKQILIKPNLVEIIRFPVTTSAESIAALIDYIRSCSGAEIVVAEGCACPGNDTAEVFELLGYTRMAREKDVRLLDLNDHDLVKLSLPGCRVFPHYYIPRIALDSFILSVPVLKRHSLAEVTLTLKNMMGFAPPSHYQQGGHWKKSFFHRYMHQAIIEMNAYRSPDMTLLDATVGMAEYHLGGAQCEPPVNKLVAGTNPVEVDKTAAAFLGVDWRKVAHIAQFDSFIEKTGTPQRH